jgi:excisionase family DNA binding protein
VFLSLKFAKERYKPLSANYMSTQSCQMINLSLTDLTQLISNCVKSELQQLTNFIAEKPKENLNQLLTRKETCELLNVSTTTLHHWHKDKTLPAQKIGSRVYYQKEQIMNKLNKLA